MTSSSNEATRNSAPSGGSAAAQPQAWGDHPSDDLHRLATLHGIALDYHDIWGVRHDVQDETLRALLTAIGVDASSDETTRAALAAHARARWHVAVDAALVVAEGRAPWTVVLRLPAERDASTLRWRLVTEEGHEQAGRIEPGALRDIERASFGDEAFVARTFPLPCEAPCGYHRLEILADESLAAAATLIVAPSLCHHPTSLEGERRVWGAAAQLYGVRSERNFGSGDFSDLRMLVEQWGAQGAALVGVNPLHALFAHNPAQASPYSPSSRLFVNTQYLDVEAIADFRECDEARALVRSAQFQATLDALRSAPLVDYPGVAAARLRVLELLYASFRRRHLAPGSARADAFRRFCAERGETLQCHALFEALQEHFHRADATVWGWPAWPESYRDPAAPAVAQFAAEHAERVDFHAWLQWQADQQLGAASRRAFELSLGIGLYQDLAVSIDRGGSEAWSFKDCYADGASIGAPPDDFNLNGQDWGLPPPVPERLRAAGYAPFIAILRANMRHAGALRIDHVMALQRLFWIARGHRPADGAYVRYPFADLLGIVKLESRRNRCLVIGEDLGTVPPEVRQTLSEAGVYSYRVLYFERASSGAFRPPDEYPAHALATASTHDLPTIAGWWEGRDLSLRAELGLFPTESLRDAQVIARAQDRAQLLLALDHARLLPEGATIDPASLPTLTPGFARAVQAYLAATTAKLLVVQLEDVLGVADQANFPGTVDEHPNWRRKLPLPLEQWPGDARFDALARVLRHARGRSPWTRTAEEGPRITAPPRATYRLQLNHDFTFEHATALVPYLAELGVSHVYCSPYLRARPGSRHGYDVVDHAALNPEIGNRDDFERFVATLKRHDMGQVLDIVPNHMGVMGADNHWWMDVLESGPASVYAHYFDIDWHPVDPDLVNKVVVPILGVSYGDALERGELNLAYEPDAGSFAIHYYEHRFPLDPREYPAILERALAEARADLPASALAELQSLVAALRHLPRREETAPARIEERDRDKEIHKTTLKRLVRRHPRLSEAIDAAVRRLNGTAGERPSFDDLHALLETQAYRLAFWRVAADDINYRRFSDVNDLAALRMENDDVFDATHRFVFELIAEGKVDGLRIDHPDGLYDPATYFRRLQARYAQLADDGAATRAGHRPLYVVIEKILAAHERLPEDWPVHGTTGYDFASAVDRLMIDRVGRARVDRTWRAFVRDAPAEFAEAAYGGRLEIMRSALAAELNVLATRLLRIARADRAARDMTHSTLRRTLAEVVACFPVYRTYVAQRISRQDRRYIDWAIARAKHRTRLADVTSFEFLRNVLLVRAPPDAPESVVDDYRAFAMRFQQYTAPVTAKGVEDTALFVFNRLLAQNDVGADPDSRVAELRAFHRANARRAAHWRHTLLATTTHDHKRSEDVRARLATISELPAAWRLLLRRWSRFNRGRKSLVDGAPAPSRNDEYALYQTLLGTFPDRELDAAALARYRKRIVGYATKAAREAKAHTSWMRVNDAYEAALVRFVEAILGDAPGNLFLEDLRAQVRPFAWFGLLNSVSATLLKCASPGVPDTYQGSELVDLRLVDPDNRQAVDYATRRAALLEISGIATQPPDVLASRVATLLSGRSPGLAKLWTAWRALALRRERPALFAEGDYVPIAARGACATHVVAFARRHAGEGAIVVAGRLFARLGPAPGAAPVGVATWMDTTIDLPFVGDSAVLTNVMTGARREVRAGSLLVAEAFEAFPAALFHYQDRA